MDNQTQPAAGNDDAAVVKFDGPAPSDLFSAADAATDHLKTDPGYLAYVEEVRQKRREVAAEGLHQIRKAEVLWQNYAAAMKRIGLHPLSWLEIGDRRHELRCMAANAEETDESEPTLRYHYQDRVREAAQAAGSNGR